MRACGMNISNGLKVPESRKSEFRLSEPYKIYAKVMLTSTHSLTICKQRCDKNNKALGHTYGSH